MLHVTAAVLAGAVMWLTFGPAYFAARVERRLRAAMGVPCRVNSVAGWLSCWCWGTRWGLILAIPAAIAVVTWQWLAFGLLAVWPVYIFVYLGVSLGGAVGVLCGGYVSPPQRDP